jgi:hypothetical protein
VGDHAGLVRIVRVRPDDDEPVRRRRRPRKSSPRAREGLARRRRLRFQGSLDFFVRSVLGARFAGFIVTRRNDEPKADERREGESDDDRPTSAVQGENLDRYFVTVQVTVFRAFIAQY